MEAVKVNHAKVSVRRQCELLSIPRSSLYYTPVPEKPENVKMMALMDKHLLYHPTEGVVSMVDWLREKGRRGPKADKAFVQAYGAPDLVSAQEPDQRSSEGVYQALFAQGNEDYPRQSGMVYRHYLYPYEKGLHVHDRFYRRL